MRNNVIGEAIKSNRLAQHMTQKQLAAKIGATHAAISYWENGVNIPNVRDCWKIADVFQISLDELVGRG